MSWKPAAICPECGEAAHVYSCPKPDHISKEEWQEMDDDARLEAELSERCIDQIRKWHGSGHIHSSQETEDWLKSQGVQEPELSRILTAFGF